MRKNLFFILSLFCALGAYSQDWKDLPLDEIFQQAREAAFAKKYNAAREKLTHILASKPDYADVRILLGRTYAWEDKSERAKEQFEIVLKKDPDYKDAINAMIDVLTWNDEKRKALEAANLGLKYYPNFQDFLYKKASLLHSLDQSNEALATVNQLLQVNPGDEKAVALRQTIKTGKQRYSATAMGSFETYSRAATDPAYYGAVSLGRSNDWGSSIARLNYSSRFGYTGTQGEIDLYPRIGKGMYAYLNYGYSTSRLYPNHRIGAEVYSSLPKSTEGSLGIRHLVFNSNSQVTMFTGSFGIYYKKIWASIRPFITPNTNTGTSASLNLLLRRYMGNPETFLSLGAGIGYSPENILQSSSGFTTDAIYRLKSQNASVAFQKLLKYNLVAAAELNVFRQELSYDVESYMWITNIQCRVTYRF